MLESELHAIVAAQHDEMSRKKTMPRDALKALHPVEGFALVATGIRRCGKSTLLHQWAEREPTPTLSLLFDDIRLAAFTTADFAVLDRVISAQKPANLVFDEIQLIHGWERYVKQKLDQGFRVLVTGSNATMLSVELGTHLTGRHLDRELTPFSYAEFLRYTRSAPSPRSVLDYLRRGGFPAFLATGEADVLRQLVLDVVLRDVAVRHAIRDAKPLETLAAFLLANVGSAIAPSRLTATLGVRAPSTILEWFDWLEKAYLVQRLEVFSDSAKARALAPKKIYAPDTALASAASPSRSPNTGHLLENAVYCHLRTKAARLHYWAGRDAECDFVWAGPNQEFSALQVCAELTPDNRDREFKGLLAAMQHLDLREGCIVTLHQTDWATLDGRTIRILPAHMWLREEGESPR